MQSLGAGGGGVMYAGRNSGFQQGGPQYNPSNPLNQYDNEVQGGRGIVNSYCGDPRMSASTIAQLRMQGFCR